MEKNWRTILAAAGVLLAVFWALPNFVNVDKISAWPFKQKLNYGLDIQGGLHLVLGADVQGVITESTTRLVTALKEEFSKESIPATDIKIINGTVGELLITVANAADKIKVQKFFSDRYASVLQEGTASDTSINVRYYEAYLTDYKEKVIQQAIETIRNRIDEFGVSEPSISKQGTDRILVQLPGMDDAERAKELINTTAKLDFQMINYDVTQEKLNEMISEAEKAGNYTIATLKYSEYIDRLNKDLTGKLPANTAVYFEKRDNALKMEVGSTAYLLKTDTGLGGGDLDNAFVSYGQYGEPEVALSFNAAGANKFAELTGANVGKQMAIVLDRVVKSAPNIKDRISGGSAVIQMGNAGTGRDEAIKDAQMIATSLRAGALPARLEQLEERRVGPTLGADSIKKAQLGALVGSGLIFLFLIIYYKAMGVVAVTSIAVNITALIALLASFGATLTLPGIAGIALTVGFAVDANVLIQERIKEELLKGSSWMTAMKEGYSVAMSAILDSNVTVGAVSVILFYFGTGPVRGFAVTLLLGILTTLFGNVFFSKVIADTLVYKFGIKKLSI